jgi:hypothetical protein
MRAANGFAAAVTLLSALAVLGSDFLDPGYRAAHRDAPWFVAAYAALQAVTVHAFVRDTRLVPWLAVARAAAGLGFLATFAVAGSLWMAWTPGRYVYQLFDWGNGVKVPLFAMTFLGRGAWNVVSAFYFTQPSWWPLRVRHPLLGRLVTAAPIAATALCLWAFLQLVRMEAQTFSPEAHEIAEIVSAGLDCATIRARNGETSSDVRERGQRRYEIQVRYGCAETRVVVRDPDGRFGTAGGPRRECCAP